MPKQDVKIPKCRVLQLKLQGGVLILIKNWPSVQTAATSLGVKPETLYSYCRRIGETLRGSYWMAY